MKGFKEFLGEEDGVAIIEIVLILVILIGLIVVFNTKIKSLNTKILKKITIESNNCYEDRGRRKSDHIFCPESVVDFIFSACITGRSKGIGIANDGYPCGRYRNGLCGSGISDGIMG